MGEWLHILLIAIGGILALILVLILKTCLYPKNRDRFVVSDEVRCESLQHGIARLHQVSPHHQQLDSKKQNADYSGFQRFFDWKDHPSLANDAVENGWPQFAFTTLVSFPNSVKFAKTALLGTCAASDYEAEFNAEIGWEVSEGSADFMQRIRLNPGLKKIIPSNSSMGALSVIKTALPLPGPSLENLCFPQEAYFEITILPSNENVDDHLVDRKELKEKPEGDKVMLIAEDFNTKYSLPDSLNHVTSNRSQRKNIFQDMKFGAKYDGKTEAILLSVGLTGNGAVPLKFPGSYPGSLGFNSSGSVYLEGTKIVQESENDEWGKPNKVIGCGYNPRQKKVFFTLDSQLVHEIHCKSEDFSFPLYPVLAANADVMVLVNLGQSSFKFVPANAQRTSNPCFIGLLENSPGLGYDDSKELFSMGRIDAQWFQRGAARSNNTVNSLKALEYDQESEGELFEIVLDSNGRSPYTNQ